MYMKEPEKCYRYNDAEDADFTKIVDPKHTALLMIDMQNDFVPQKENLHRRGGLQTASLKLFQLAGSFWKPPDRPMYSSFTFSKVRCRGSRVITEAG